MKVVCAWCEAEGKPAVVREKEPLDDPEETHGVCAEHKAIFSGADGAGNAAHADSERES